MKPEEAIEILRGRIDLTKKVWSNVPEIIEYREALELAVDAIRKQVPLRIKEEKWIDTKCVCGHVFSKHFGDGYHDIPFQSKTEYCHKCGQKLDWSEENGR